MVSSVYRLSKLVSHKKSWLKTFNIILKWWRRGGALLFENHTEYIFEKYSLKVILIKIVLVPHSTYICVEFNIEKSCFQWIVYNNYWYSTCTICMDLIVQKFDIICRKKTKRSIGSHSMPPFEKNEIKKLKSAVKCCFKIIYHPSSIWSIWVMMSPGSNEISDSSSKKCKISYY